ncbi:MAG: SDR family NAD(P)-dependent oxidoreductase, partial [Burkholderiaceae bacterium]
MQQAKAHGFAVLGLSRRTAGLPALSALDVHGGSQGSSVGSKSGKPVVCEQSLDLADANEVARFVSSAALSRFFAQADRVLLINNAGLLSPIGPVGRLSSDAIYTSVAANVSGPIALTDAFIKAIPESALDRRVMHVSSGAARSAYAGWNVYCATKAALDHHARAVQLEAMEPGPAKGLRICSLAPGVIDTEMQDQVRATRPEDFPMRPRFDDLKAQGALAAPTDVAKRLLTYMLSESFGSEPVADLRSISL